MQRITPTSTYLPFETSRTFAALAQMPAMLGTSARTYESRIADRSALRITKSSVVPRY
jgi:hypothetical protein